MNAIQHNPCAVIPVYNHGATVAPIVRRLRLLGLPCILVNDGSTPDCAATLDTLAEPKVTVLHRASNGGKGAAVRGCGPQRALAIPTPCKSTRTASTIWMTPPGCCEHPRPRRTI